MRELAQSVRAWLLACSNFSKPSRISLKRSNRVAASPTCSAQSTKDGDVNKMQTELQTRLLARARLKRNTRVSLRVIELMESEFDGDGRRNVGADAHYVVRKTI